jgi:hypothetical protein
MKRKMDALNTAQHKAAETMYRGAAGAAGGASAGSQPGGQQASGQSRESGDVIDAEVVEEEKK